MTDLAHAIGASGSAVHRILTALKKKGLVQQATENGPYSLSWSILALAQRLMAHADVRTIALPFMTALRDTVRETVTLNVRSGFARVCIDQAVGPHEVSWRKGVGQVAPLGVGATGKVFLAYLPEPEFEAFWAETKLEKLTPHTIIHRRELARELEVVRDRGLAFGIQDRLLGVAGISAPIFDAPGRVAAALTIAGPTERCTPEQLETWVKPLKAATGEISNILTSATNGSPNGG
jgi:DNA-binding IclR family transcriptional regulator